MHTTVKSICKTIDRSFERVSDAWRFITMYILCNIYIIFKLNSVDRIFEVSLIRNRELMFIFRERKRCVFC